MKALLLSSVLVTAILGAAGGTAISSYMTSSAVMVHAQGKSQFAPGHQSTGPNAVGTWFGVARPCPAAGDDAGTRRSARRSAATCPRRLARCRQNTDDADDSRRRHRNGERRRLDRGVPHNGAGRVGRGSRSEPSAVCRQDALQASFVWLQGDGGQPGQFIGVARPRFVTYWDPANPDNMIGYIQPHFFPIVGAGGLVDLRSGFKGSLNVTNHYPVIDPLAQLPHGCTPIPERRELLRHLPLHHPSRQGQRTQLRSSPARRGGHGRRTIAWGLHPYAQRQWESCT